MSFPWSLCFRLEEVVSLAADLLTQSPVVSRVVSLCCQRHRGEAGRAPHPVRVLLLVTRRGVGQVHSGCPRPGPRG